MDADAGGLARTGQPSPADPSRITELLVAASNGNTAALNALIPLVYDDLKRLAHRRLRAEPDGHTLDTTALVHEAYVRLVDQTRVQWRDRAHFFGVASEAMRRILVNHAVALNAAKRGSGAKPVPLDGIGVALTEPQADELLALDEALTRLETFNPRGAKVVVGRFFAGLTYAEIAEALGTSHATVRRSWAAARAWLRQELGDAASSLRDGGITPDVPQAS